LKFRGSLVRLGKIVFGGIAISKISGFKD